MISDKAIIDPKAEIGTNVEVGPFSIIGEGVQIKDGTRIGSHTVIEGPTQIGSDNFINHHAVIGAPPQDLKYDNEPTRLVIGDQNIIREFTTLHRGTDEGGGITSIGNKNMIMAYAHVAHDCQIGNEVILANAVNMAGHVHIDDFVIVGGLSAIHQFVRIGRYAIVGGLSAIAQDVIPFALVAGPRSSMHGINAIGLKRRGFDPVRRKRIHKVVRYLLKQDINTKTAIRQARKEFGDDGDITEILEFIESSDRGICLR